MLKKALDGFNGVVDRITRWLHYIGVSLLLVMVFLTTLDVSLRYFLNQPLSGSYELMEYMMVVLVSFGLAYTARRDAHIRVTVLIDKLPARLRAGINSITTLASIGLLSLVTWQCWLYILEKYRAGTESSVLQIPMYPFVAVVMLGMAVFVLTMIAELFSHAMGLFKS